MNLERNTILTPSAPKLIRPAAPQLLRARTRDAMRTFDQATIDSTGAFLVGQLEQLDRTIHEPLQEFSWSRDMDVRSDVTMGNDFSSYTNSAMASPGGIDPTKKAFISKDSSTLPNVALDIGKTASPLIPWGLELNYSIFELESAQLLGQSIDEEKFYAIRQKHQQDTDIQVYLGDSEIPNCYGLINSPQVTTTGNVAAAGASSPTGNTGSLKWIDKTPAAILQDVNTLLTAVWTASAFAKCPTKLLLPPVEYGYISTTLVSSAGNTSILTYIQQNCVSTAVNGRPLEIKPLKWLTGTSNGNALAPAAADSMVAYTQEYRLIRFPMVPMMGLPVQFKGASQLRPYVCKLGCVEFVYPETIGYAQGIG